MEKDNQKFMKKLDNFDQSMNRIMNRLVIFLYAIFTCFIFAATFYYGVCEIQGNGNTKQFTICSTMLLVLAAIPVCNKFVDLFLKRFLQKNDAFDPRAMVLPAHGVTLEDALHKMSTQTGVIVWDTIWGCVVFSLLCLLAFGIGNRPRILFLCVCVIALIAVGHIVLKLLWKRRSYVKKMLRNTSKIIGLNDPVGFAAAIEESLKRGVLSYEKELILTDEYILGSVEWDIHYTPVAIQKAQITEFVFFYRRMVGSRYSRTIGILRCVRADKQVVDLALGPYIKSEKIKKILAYYKISWREEQLTYV